MSYQPWPEPDDGDPATARNCPSPAVTGSGSAAPPPPPSPQVRYYALALVMVLAGCTGPSWFRLMGPGPSGVTKAFYRMLLTALLQGPLALFLEGRSCDRPRARAWARKAARVMCPVGAAMGLHFACVATSITSTSFIHSMAFVNTSPLFFCALVALRCTVSRARRRGAGGAENGFFHPSRSPAPHGLEVLGAALAFGGVVALSVLDAGAATGAGDVPVTAGGDAAGLFASFFMALYLMGSTRRGDTKLVSWMFPLHAAAAVATGLLAVAGGATVDAGPAGLFALFASERVFLATLGSVALPSFVCHSLANWLASGGRLSPFLVSILLCMQPLTGNLFGYVMGLQGVPSAVGLACAPLVVAGCVLATVGMQRQRAKEAAAAAAAAQTAAAAAAAVQALESPQPPARGL